MTNDLEQDRSGEQQEQPPSEQPLGTRRRFFGLLGAGLLGLATGKLTTNGDARAADGDALAVGQTTISSAQTKLSATGVIANDGALMVEAPNADYGIVGSGKSVGVVGKGPIGLYGEGTVGGVFTGTDVALSLTPRGTPGPASTESLKGDLLVDANGVLWLCTASGTPGSWIEVSHGGTRMLPAPYRAYSSTDPGKGGTIARGEKRTIPILGVVPGIPANARGIVGNLTVHQTIGAGFVSAFPTGQPVPPTSSLNLISAPSAS